MKKTFEDKFMECQTELISLCLEVTENKVDKIFAYASIEKKSIMFNAFFEKAGNILTLNQLNIDERRILEFLKIGTRDLINIKKLCEENAVQTLTEIKMYYDAKLGKYDAAYRYDEVCSDKTGMSSGDIFMKWYNEIKEKP